MIALYVVAAGITCYTIRGSVGWADLVRICGSAVVFSSVWSYFAFRKDRKLTR